MYFTHIYIYIHPRVRNRTATLLGFRSLWSQQLGWFILPAGRELWSEQGYTSTANTALGYSAHPLPGAGRVCAALGAQSDTRQQGLSSCLVPLVLSQTSAPSAAAIQMQSIWHFQIFMNH